ncbi:aminotransferase class I/II-fold pyridoxal phosphate-dependent enzyme [Galbitalea soli]|uniref:Aminotransferase class I/II-fold pyridoxal phosphate-dependent enzyme n=1 Tax=Galbitalea soli TaxID=1268042 RepID=A0A7C9PM76_9MICO|nr:aminotransferase class I/II-fold pyridoxal phosphate-dependent enzyme [Galbitalea soli]NEM90569.1 aminotransferase class I/II-fold pyridoxal phosphate-dependent enzyme [Galbitalea soli]NYJ31285.1 N-succinyldiaminopimelate aminotransferase [Galbitalea soli]
MTVSGAWQRAARGAMLLGDDGVSRPTIFAEMSALATSRGAINLGQGFPDEDGPAEVLDAARRAISDGLNQYPPGRGMPVLRDAIAEHQARFYGLAYDPDTEVLVTAGATEAIAASILALTEAGDEVVTFEPFYDEYGAIAALAGATHVTVPLRAPAFQPDLDELRAAVSDRTRIILINSPHNPTGTVLGREALELIVELAHAHDALIVTDEVYEHLTFGVPHIPIASLPGARERTVSISSGGKTFNTTGWKIGWLTAPAEIVDAIVAVKQFLTYVNGAPFQPAIAAGLRLPDAYFRQIAGVLQGKRDLLAAGLTRAGFRVSSPQGGYFVIADAAPLGYPDAAELCRRLPDLAGVVGVPVSAFVRTERAREYASLIRFAYCKKLELLEGASAGLVRLGAR